MKKILLVFLLIAALIFVGGFVFLPSSYTIQKSINIRTNKNAFTRNMIETIHWEPWWPGRLKTTDANGFKTFEWDEKEFRISDRKYAGLDISISNTNYRASSNLNLFTLGTDSFRLVWEVAIHNEGSVLGKWGLNFFSRSVEKDVSDLLEKAVTFYQKKNSYYSLDITQERVVDSNLIYTSSTFTSYPIPEQYYPMLQSLKKYIDNHDAHITGLPMLNVTKLSDKEYFTRVAFPIDRTLPDSGQIAYRWMLGMGFILKADVTGGPVRVEQALTEMDKYAEDHDRTPPAIPFQSIVTDRLAERDTSKWKTRLFYPVM